MIAVNVVAPHFVNNTPFCTTYGIKKYKGHCLFCFFHLFPNEPTTRNYKTNEAAVATYIKEKFSQCGLSA